MAGQMIPGFDAAVNEMEVGETRNVHIPCAEAYGEYREDMVQKIPVSSITNADQLPVGGMVVLQTADGRPLQAKVVSVDSEFAAFDLNHEMAGKDLNFEITLLTVEQGKAGSPGRAAIYTGIGNGDRLSWSMWKSRRCSRRRRSTPIRT
jgi:FKBP-type peptidyl-prolyl cis-trans isomerase 2